MFENQHSKGYLFPPAHQLHFLMTMRTSSVPVNSLLNVRHESYFEDIFLPSNSRKSFFGDVHFHINN